MASTEDSSPSKRDPRLLYGPDVTMIIGSQKAFFPRTYRGNAQIWRNYQCLIAEVLELPYWKDYKTVLCEKYRHQEIPKEDRTISCLLDHMSTPHHRARFFFEDAIPKICLDPGREKPRYCTAEDATYLRHLILRAMESPFGKRMPVWTNHISQNILELCGFGWL